MDQAAKLRALIDKRQRTEPIPTPAAEQKLTMRVISVTSGKGGVGKTNFTVNLAINMAAAGKRVVVIDADFGLANVELLLGVSPRYSFRDVLEGTVTISEALTNGPNGIKFLSGGSGLTNMTDISDAQIAVLLDGFVQLDAITDVLLIDTGAGITKQVTNFLKASDETIVVTTADPTSITDAYALIKTLMADNKNPPAIKIVVNRVDNQQEGKEVFERLFRVCSKFLKLRIINLGCISYDKNLVRAVKVQEPVSILYPRSESNKQIASISKRILNTGTTSDSPGVWQFLDRWIGFMKQ